MSLIKTLIAALTLATASLSAHAEAVYRFTGTIDFGSRIGDTLDGEFSMADVANDFDGSLALLSFSLNVFGQTYLLSDADSPATALFVAGTFAGVEYSASSTSDPALRPIVSLMPGFFDTSLANFAYDTTGNGTEGFATPAFERLQTVPEPTSAALLLLGLVGAGALRRRR